MSRVKIVTPKRKNPLGVATSKGAFHLVGLTVIIVPVKLLATATTAASGGSREELLGQRPAGCKRQRSRLWEPQPGQWHRAARTERARPLTMSIERSDMLPLRKALLIAVWRLFYNRLALSVNAGH